MLDVLVRHEMDEDDRAADVEIRMRLRPGLRLRPEQPLVELRESGDVRREERDLGDPSHEGTIRQCSALR